MWDKELEAKKILAKEKVVTNTFIKHRDGSTPTPRKIIGYARESVQQSDYFQWAVNSYIEDIAGFLFHIPNEGDTGGEAGAIKGGIKLAMGVVAGAPDMSFCPDLFAEIKLPENWLSPNQEYLHKRWHEKKGVRIPVIDHFLEWRQWIECDCLQIRKQEFNFRYYDTRKKI